MSFIDPCSICGVTPPEAEAKFDAGPRGGMATYCPRCWPRRQRSESATQQNAVATPVGSATPVDAHSLSFSSSPPSADVQSMKNEEQRETHMDSPNTSPQQATASPVAPDPTRAAVEAMRERLRVLLANPRWASTHDVLAVRLETLDELMDDVARREAQSPVAAPSLSSSVDVQQVIAEHWRPIETAPKRREVLVLLGGGTRKIAYLTDQEPPMVNTWRAQTGEQIDGWPIRWTELPAVPSIGELAEGADRLTALQGVPAKQEQPTAASIIRQAIDAEEHCDHFVDGFNSDICKECVRDAISRALGALQGVPAGEKETR